MLGLPYLYKWMGKPVPYYARYPLWLIIWKPIRKFLNVVIIPAVPFSGMRVLLYRMIGFKIGKNVFIGMRCYMDDVEPRNTVIGNNVTISYGTFFATHGKGQRHTTIHIKDHVYIGMCCNILSGKEGITLGQNCIIGAGSLVNQSIPDYSVAVGVPVKVIGENTEPNLGYLGPPD